MASTTGPDETARAAQTENHEADTPRPVTYDEAASAYDYAFHARERHDELAIRRALADARAALIARGEYDPAQHGTEEHQPLTVEEQLEVLATGEVVARLYRHPADVDRALKAGATWAQVAAARGCSEEQARRDYRAWAESQHRLWASEFRGGTRFGLNDHEYAEAIARLTEPEGEAGA